MTLIHPGAMAFVGLAGALLAGCQSAPPLMPRWSLDRLELGAPPPSIHRAIAIDRQAVAPSPLPATAHRSGGRAAAPADPGALGEGYVLLPGGRRLPLPAADELALPAGLGAEWSYFAPGRVPVTLAGVAGLERMHPRAIAAPPEPMAQATVSGSVSPAEPGVVVGHFTPEGLFSSTTTDAEGRFELSVALAGEGEGLLFARTNEAQPRLAIQRLSLAPGAARETPLALVVPGGSTPAPAPPPGLALTGSALELHAASWGATLWADARGGSVPTYPGLAALASAFVAESADGDRGSVVAAPPGESPAFLSPPDLASLPDRLTAGTRLAWPAVPGAGLYTLSLTSLAATAPIWEGASPHPSLTLPAGLALTGPLILTVTAWQAEGVSVYSVASARQLRLPLGGVRGAFAWARHVWGAGPKTPATP